MFHGASSVFSRFAPKSTSGRAPVSRGRAPWPRTADQARRPEAPAHRARRPARRFRPRGKRRPLHEQRDACVSGSHGDKGGNGGLHGQRQQLYARRSAARRARDSPRANRKAAKGGWPSLEAELPNNSGSTPVISAEAAILQRHVVQRHVARDGCDFLAHQAGHAPVEQLFRAVCP